MRQKGQRLSLRGPTVVQNAIVKVIRELSTFTLTTVTVTGAVYASKNEQRANGVAG